MNANNRQEGGKHYNSKEYQHWDFVCDTGLHYLLGCATKYPSRWREKNGIEDLRKSIHYIDKAEELNIYCFDPVSITSFISKFCNQLPKEEHGIIYAICNGDYRSARILLNRLINDNP